jgi:GntR family transcriptional regulator
MSVPQVWRASWKRIRRTPALEVNKLNLESLTKYREIGRVFAPESIAKTLDLRKGEDALGRRRVLYANGEPTQIADSYYPWSIAKGSDALLCEDAGQGGSYARLAELGYAPVRFAEDVTVRVPDDAEQRTLELEAIQPVFEIWHVAYAADHRAGGGLCTRHDRAPVEAALRMG